MKRSFKDVEHLVRLAAIFVFGGLLFVVARAALVPADFGTLGHYRAGAIDDVRSRPIKYAGQAACVDCHSDVLETRAPAKHVALSCETCHGPLAAHVEDQEPTVARIDMQPLCIRCHAANTGKPKGFPAVDVAEHTGDEPCVNCHKPHNPRVE